MKQVEKQNILIVDDRWENLHALETLLERPGLNIVKAASGDEALEFMLEYDFALVLLDVQMPGIDGFETAELIRGSKRTKYVPIIFVTAINKEKKYVFKGYEVGAVDYLFKPLDPDVLRSKVNVFLELHRKKTKLLEKEKVLSERNQELELLKERLEERVRERTKELEKANIELVRLNQVKSDFISLVSHELRTPLTPIKTFTQILSKHVEELTPEEMREYLSIINIETDRLHLLISSVLDVQKIDSGKMVWKDKECNFVELAGYSVEFFDRSYRDKGLVLSLDAEKKEMTAVVDPDKIKQVFFNLLSNALKFTEEGEVKVVLKQNGSGIIKVSISDTGPGIPSEEIGKVFERFYQVDSSAEREQGGSGLGLAICKAIVEHYQGEIRVESGPDGGSTFVFCIPPAEKHGAPLGGAKTESEMQDSEQLLEN